jgi:hypothetical protein
MIRTAQGIAPGATCAFRALAPRETPFCGTVHPDAKNARFTGLTAQAGLRRIEQGLIYGLFRHG